MISYQLLSYAEMDKEALYDVMALRQRVFVVGMKAIYQDMDHLDQRCWHLLARDEAGELVGTVRLLPAGLGHYGNDGCSFGRLSVLPEWRGRGIGAELVQRAVRFLTEEQGNPGVRISAMAYLEPFYARLGFRTLGGVFDIDGVPHIEMAWGNPEA